MSHATPEPRFLDRFERIWSSLRRYQARRGLAWSCLAATLGLAILAATDYAFELPRPTRTIGLAVAGAAAVFTSWRTVLGPLRRWTLPRTAVEVERRFPELGQRIRTVVQFAGLPEEVLEAEGVAGSLVDSLEDETGSKAGPLPLDAVVPQGRVRAYAALAALPALVLAVASALDPEWRTAVARALLSRRPYTTLSVSPGNLTIEQGASVPIAVTLKGRSRRDVVLFTRDGSSREAPWTAAALEPADPKSIARREATLEHVERPFEYRVAAGPATSPTYRVGVRYPLAIKSFEVSLRPPAYTGLDPTTVEGGDLVAVEGTGATFRLAFDVPDVKASLVISETPGPAPMTGSSKSKAGSKPQKSEAPPPRVIPLKPGGGAFAAELVLARDLTYRIEARTADGRTLPETRYRIDVREDRAPRVAFDEPEEALEVHPIAEVAHRARVVDDFGLTRAGIVFRVDDGEERSLILEQFAPKSGKPRTTGVLEATLLLETLGLSPTRSVTYYAFAEDNYPGGSRRTETDLRYIDIRPFRREYKLRESAAVADEETLTTLEELIARQRFNLNRTVRLAKHRPADRTEPEDPLKIASFEELLASLTREFTEGVEGIINERVEALHRAEGAMLSAVEALDRRAAADASSREAEALAALVEARRSLLIELSQDGSQAAAMRQFDRIQAQKIRKPRSKDEEAESVAAEIEELADDEEFVYATIASLLEGGQDGKEKKGETSPEPKEDAQEGPEGDPTREAAEAPGGSTDANGSTGPGKAAGKGGVPSKGEDPGTGEVAKHQEAPDGMKAPGTEGDKGQAAASPKAGRTDPGAEEKGREGVGPKKPQGDAKRPSDQGVDQGRDGSGGRKPPGRREIAARQEQIADRALALEERLKRLEAASELAKARMAKAAEKAVQASGALARGHSKEAAEDAARGAGMLRELARQVKGEIALEEAQRLAMARDLASELADREAELAGMPEGPSTPGSPSQQDGKPGPGSPPGKDASGTAAKPGGKGNGQGGASGTERLEPLVEAALTLKDWLEEIDRRGEGKAAEAVREILDQGKVAEVIERTERAATLALGGRQPEARREARDAARALEAIGQALDVLHREIVSPRLAALVELDRRVAELTSGMADATTVAEVAEWHRQAAALLRDLETRERMTSGVDDLRSAIADLAAGGRPGAGGWHFRDQPHRHWVVPATYTNALSQITAQVQEKIQDLLLKDMVSAHDEATPPEYNELVERYYEVLSKDRGTR